MRGRAVLNDRIVAIRFQSVSFEHLSEKNRAAGNQTHNADGRSFQFFDGFVFRTADERIGGDGHRAADDLERRASLDGVDRGGRIDDGHIDLAGDESLHQGICRTDEHDVALNAFLGKETFIGCGIVR